MLIKIDDEWIDPGQIEYVFAIDPEETGPGGVTHYRGEPGFVRFDAADDRPVLINARCVVRLREDDEATEIETYRGEKILVKGTPSWVATVLNKVQRVGRVA